MIIRKLFKFEGAHVVRNCTSERCKYSVHGHSYKVEILLASFGLDNGQMVVDFGLLKGRLKELVDSFDHAITLWASDDPDYVESMKKHSARWIVMPVSPSAEQFARVFYTLADQVLRTTKFANNEGHVEVHSVIVHETDTGYAQAFGSDCLGMAMDVSYMEFSDAIISEWVNPNLFKGLWDGSIHVNPTPVIQVPL